MLKNNIKVNNFKSKKGKFCFLSNLTEYFNFYGIQLSESFMGFLMGGYGFSYVPHGIPSKEMLIGRNGEFEELFGFLQEQLCNPISKYLLCNVEEWIRSLDSSQIALAWIDEYFLSYSLFYKKTHYWSIVVIIEMTDTNVTIYDNEIKHVDINTVSSAMMRNNQMTLYCLKDNKISFRYSYIHTLINGLERIITRFYSYSNKSSFLGIEGLNYFLKDLEYCNDSKVFYDICYLINRAGGLVVTRENIKSFCIDLNQRIATLEIEECICVYEKLSELWQKAANLIYKLSVTMDENLRQRILLRVREIIELEVNGIKKLESLADELRSYIGGEWDIMNGFESGGVTCQLSK